MAEEDTILALGAGAAVAGVAAYAFTRGRGNDEQDTQQGSGQQGSGSGLSGLALLAYLQSMQGGSSGDTEFRGENPMESGDTEDVLDDSGRYPGEEGYSGGSGSGSSSPDDSASGEPAHRGADPTEHGDRFDSGDSGEPDTNVTEYNGYRYTGTETQDFRDWVNGDITTEQFQTRTGQGNGTAAVTNWQELGDPELDEEATGPTPESEQDRTFYDPGLSDYVQGNPSGISIGDFGQYQGYTIARDLMRDSYQWLLLDDSGGWQSFASEDAAEDYLDEQIAESREDEEPSTDPANSGDPEYQGENPEDYGDTEDALGDGGSYDTSPDDGASGEPAHRGADPTEHGDRFDDDEDDETENAYDRGAFG